MHPARAVRLMPLLLLALLLPALPALARPALDASTLTLTSSASNPPHGQLLTFTATVSGSGACVPAAGENIAFTVDGASAATAQITAAGVATYASSVLSPGQHTIAASYNGDAACEPSNASLTQQIGNVGATLIALTAGVGTPASGTAVVFTALVTGTASPCVTPTGSVSFTETTGGISQYLGSAPLGTPGPNEALFAYLGFAAGPHSVVASYAGDNNCAASTSGAASVTAIGIGPPIIGPNGQANTAPTYSGAPIVILTGVGKPATQALYPGCTAVSLSSLAGTPLAAVATLFNPIGGVTGIWRYDPGSRRYYAGFLAAGGAPLDFTVTNGGPETYAVCTSVGGAIHSTN